MSDELVVVYEAIDLPQAEMVHQALEAAGIDAWVEQTPSPLDGLTVMNQGTHVRVRQDDAGRAQQRIAEFLAERADDPPVD